MSNTLSRLLDVLLSPWNIVFFVIVLGVVLLFTRWQRYGRLGLAAFCGLGFCLMLWPMDFYMTSNLEDRFVPSLPDHVDGIVMLGGAINISISLARHHPSLNEFADRDTELIVLMHRYPQAKIVFTGGAANPFDQVHKEAQIFRDWLIEMGENPDRVIFEDQSRNTHENALFTKDLVHPQADQNWLLVTSAIHMPRSVGSFRAVGWQVYPWPVNYQTLGQGRLGRTAHFFTTRRLSLFSNSLHEWIGLVYYRLRGWSPSLFPAP